MLTRRLCCLVAALIVLASCDTPESIDEGGLSGAIGRDDLAGVQAEIASGADVNEPDEFGAMPLVLAAIHSSAELVTFLLDAGANANTSASGSTLTPLLAASTRADSDSASIVGALLAAGADPCVRLLSAPPNPADQGRFRGMNSLEIAESLGAHAEVALLAAASTDCT